MFFQTCKETQDIGALTKAADFVKAFVLGFQVEVGTLLERSLTSVIILLLFVNVLCGIVQCL